MTASTPGSGSAIGPATSPPLTRRWSRVLVAGTALAVAALALVHLAATFLYNAPSNPVSQRLDKQVTWWMDPLFTQNWRLFAPNPISENVQIEARASLDPDGRVTGWVDLSALDQAAVRDDPVPGHVTENALRNAWFQWVETHDDRGDPIGADAEVMQRYLVNVVIDRLRGRVAGAVGSVQVRAVTTLLPGPGRTAAQTVPQIRTLDWWTATEPGKGDA